MTDLVILASERALRDLVTRHVAEAAFLGDQRIRAKAAPNFALRHLRRLDERIAANLDGIQVGGPTGRRAAQAGVDETAGSVFALAVTLLEMGTEDLETIIATRGEFDGRHWCGALMAIGWVAWRTMLPRLRAWVQSPVGLWQRLSVAVCSSHRVDPATHLVRWLCSIDSDIRNEALKAAGELGRIDVLGTCMDAINDEDQKCRESASISAVLLGEHRRAVRALLEEPVRDGLHLHNAFRIALQTLPISDGHAVLREYGQDATSSRLLIEGSGVIGDAAYVAWLIQSMASDKTARVAGEAFALITGADLELNNLGRKPPENVESGPNDDPDDPNVDMDPDDGLPWPDVKKVEAWWHANEHRFQKGTRYFMGQAVTKEHCIHVLKTGYQRQRILAAQYLCLLEPGTPLFNTAAPAWRQQRLLAAM
jgi:uncharacterized protein (TIGR02270 family)